MVEEGHKLVRVLSRLVGSGVLVCVCVCVCVCGHYPPSSPPSGTHGYMAPEVIKKGVQYTFTADWFSLGCVLYKLLRG